MNGCQESECSRKANAQQSHQKGRLEHVDAVTSDSGIAHEWPGECFQI